MQVLRGSAEYEATRKGRVVTVPATGELQGHQCVTVERRVGPREVGRVGLSPGGDVGSNRDVAAELWKAGEHSAVDLGHRVALADARPNDLSRAFHRAHRYLAGL